MKGDFSRLDFNRLPAADRPEGGLWDGAMLQQGRAVLDSDWNRQLAAARHRLRRTLADVIGPSGGPANALGFAISIAYALPVGPGASPITVPPANSPASTASPFTVRIGLRAAQEGVVFALGGIVVSAVQETDGLHLRLDAGGAAGPMSAAVSRGTLDSDRFNDVVLTGNGTELHLHLDGEVEGTVVHGGGPCGPITIATPPAGSAESGVTGMIDRLSLWSVALPGPVVRAVAANAAGEPSAGLLAALSISADWAELRDGSNTAVPLAIPPGARPQPSGDLVVGAGRYYVDGVLCENPAPVLLTTQPDRPDDAKPLRPDARAIVALRVWDRLLTALQAPWLPEPALGGPDTVGVVQPVWQVVPLPLQEGESPAACWNRRLTGNDPARRGALAARRTGAVVSTVENTLYRVEIAHGGVAAPGGPVTGPITDEFTAEVLAATPLAGDPTWLVVQAPPDALPVGGFLAVQAASPTTPTRGSGAPFLAAILSVEAAEGGSDVQLGTALPAGLAEAASLQAIRVATFKWSRRNGCVAFPVADLRPSGGPSCTALLAGPGFNGFDLAVGDWVEFSNDRLELSAASGPLYKVVAIDRARLELRLTGAVPAASDLAAPLHPLLRRWDVDRTVADDEPVKPVRADGWKTLENGVQVRFAASGTYHSGDYWTIPVRDVPLCSVEWPDASLPGTPALLPPEGIRYHDAPLALVDLADGSPQPVTDLRAAFRPLAPTISLPE